jgi:hypothetical protein
MILSEETENQNITFKKPFIKYSLKYSLVTRVTSAGIVGQSRDSGQSNNN